MASVSEHTLSGDKAGVAEAIALFESSFPNLGKPTVAAAAPGRVNLIGEHTDYNDGFVFPLALTLNTYVVGKPLPAGEKCKIISKSTAAQGGVVEFSIDPPLTSGDIKWAKYVRGMAVVYAESGYALKPFAAAIYSDVPLGAGVSSSASLEVSVGQFLELLNGLEVSGLQRAKMAQKCEHEHLDVKCGIMDQLISSCAQVGHALLIDCRNCDMTSVPLNDPDAVILVADSKDTHDLSGSESPYSVRVRQCKKAASAMDLEQLRSATLPMLEKVKDKIDEVSYRRARHVISENDRTLEARECLQTGNLERFGELMVKSHESLRDDFEVSSDGLNALVEIAMSVDGVYGSRMTGGGFGGCTVTLVKKDAVPNLLSAIEQRYPAMCDGKIAKCFVTTAGAGARNVSALI